MNPRCQGRKKPKPVSFDYVNIIRRAARDDRGIKWPTTVILDGCLQHYVGIGWIDVGEAKPADYFKYPEVK